MKRSLLNVITSVCYQVVSMLVGFVLQRHFLLVYGSEMNGLLSSIAQLLAYLSLFEAGVGAATTQALYGLVGRNEIYRINGVLSATDRYYKRTALYYFCAIVVISFIYPLLLEASVPKSTISLIVLISGIPGVIPFLSYGKLSLLLVAESKLYIINSINICVATVSGLLRLLLIQRSINIITLQSVYIFLALLQMTLYGVYFNKHKKWLNISVPPDNDSISQKNSALFHQVSSLVFSNTDILIISFTFGLKSTSIYTLYNVIFSMVGTLISNMYSGVRSKLGQLYNTDIQRYKSVFKLFESFFIGISFAFICTSYVVVLPFIEIYTSGVLDINYIDSWLPVCFVSIQLLTFIRIPMFDTVYFAGHIKATRLHSAAEAFINLVASLLLIIPFGFYGVLIGTVVALLFRYVVMLGFIKRMEKSICIIRTVVVHVMNCLLFVLCVWLSRMFDFSNNTYLDVFVAALVHTMIFLLIFLVANGAFNFKYIREYRRNLKGSKKVLRENDTHNLV